MTDADLFFAVDHPLPAEDFQSRVTFKQTPLTPERFREIADAMLAAPLPGPHIEFHHPQCPKILTKGAKACRCGAAPTEWIFEDALAAEAEPPSPNLPPGTPGPDVPAPAPSPPPDPVPDDDPDDEA